MQMNLIFFIYEFQKCFSSLTFQTLLLNFRLHYIRKTNHVTPMGFAFHLTSQVYNHATPMGFYVSNGEKNF